MSDHEDNTTNERPGTSTDSGAQNMPSANVFADMFKAALAPVLSQLTTLNENVSAVLLNEHEDSEEDGEAASNDRPAMSADMDADLSALLVSAGKDDNTEAMPGEDLLKELAPELAVSEKTSPPLREGLAAIFNNLLSEKMGDEKLKAKLDKYPRPENVKGLRTPKVNPSIWSQLPTSMKTQDVRSQKGQNTLIGAISADKYGPLPYRHLERDKYLALVANKGDYGGGEMQLSPPALAELQWWRDNAQTLKRDIQHAHPSTSIQSDASTLRWGAVFGT